MTPDHAAEVWRSFENHIFPSIGNVPIGSLTARQTISVLESVKNKGHLSTLHRLIQRINDVMSYAVNTGLIDINPISKIEMLLKGIKHSICLLFHQKSA